LGTVDRIALCAAGMDATDLFRLETPDQTGLSDEVQIYNLLVEYSPEDRDRLRVEGCVGLPRFRGEVRSWD